MKTFDIISYLDHLKPEKIKLTHKPVNYGPEHYSRSIDKAIDYLSRFDEIAAVYRIGSVSDPGISDIDLIAVFHDGAKAFPHPYRNKFDSRDAYLFMHGIYGMPAGIFKQREFLIPIYQCRRLSGREIDCSRELSEDEGEFLEKLYALEYVAINLFNLASQFVQRQLKVRNLLCSLKSLAGDFEILAGQDKGHQLDSIKTRIIDLRSSWFEDEITSLSDFYRICIDVFKSTLGLLGEFFAFPEKITRFTDHFSPVQVGPNSYLVESNNGQHALSSLRVYRKTGFGFLNRLAASLPDSGFRRQIKDLQTAWYALFLTLPSHVYSVMIGSIDGAFGRVYRKRKDIIEQYSLFMENINPEYVLFDIFRWHHHNNRKWNLFRTFNKSSFFYKGSGPDI